MIDGPWGSFNWAVKSVFSSQEGRTAAAVGVALDELM